MEWFWYELRELTWLSLHHRLEMAVPSLRLQLHIRIVIVQNPKYQITTQNNRIKMLVWIHVRTRSRSLSLSAIMLNIGMCMEYG